MVLYLHVNRAQFRRAELQLHSSPSVVIVQQLWGGSGGVWAGGALPPLPASPRPPYRSHHTLLGPGRAYQATNNFHLRQQIQKSQNTLSKWRYVFFFKYMIQDRIRLIFTYKNIIFLANYSWKGLVRWLQAYFFIKALNALNALLKSRYVPYTYH